MYLRENTKSFKAIDMKRAYCILFLIQLFIIPSYAQDTTYREGYSTKETYARKYDRNLRMTIYEGIVDVAPMYKSDKENVLPDLHPYIKDFHSKYIDVKGKDNEIITTLIISFIITRKGDIVDVKIECPYHELSETSIKQITDVVTSLKDWVPGKVNHHRINYRIAFRLNF